MLWRRAKYFRLGCILASLALSNFAMASEYRGLVIFGDAPLPGASITVTQGGKKFTTVADEEGNYSFPDLADGAWKVDVEMSGFVKIDQEVTVAPSMPVIRFDMKMLPVDQMIA